MAKTYVIGDIHGGLKALQQVLEKAAVTHQDTLIFLGDYVDGWSESPAVIDFFIAISQTHNCIFLRGNHDELALHWLQMRLPYGLQSVFPSIAIKGYNLSRLIRGSFNAPK